jgi:hypothetical protein
MLNLVVRQETARLKKVNLEAVKDERIAQLLIVLLEGLLAST